jgi:uncharacterized membrane protein YqjE
MVDEHRSISEVLGDIADDVQHIVRSELQLAKVELRKEIGKAISAGVLFGIGVLLLIFAVLFLLLAAVYALSIVLPAWAAALIVGGGIGLIAALCVAAGVARSRRMRALPQTTATMKENVEWTRQLTR